MITESFVFCMSQTDTVGLGQTGRIRRTGWRALRFVFGPGTDLESYNSTAAQQLLPAKLIDIAKPEQAILAPSQMTHPILAPLRELGENDLADGPIKRFWKVQDSAKRVPQTLSSLIPRVTRLWSEPSFGEGRHGHVLLLTTTTYYQQAGEPWNELALGWSFVLLGGRNRSLSGGHGRDEAQLQHRRNGRDRP